MKITLDELLRFERGELDEDHVARVRAALDEDPGLRGELAWIHGLRLAVRSEEPEAAGGEPAGEDEIAALAMGALDAVEAADVRRRLLSTPDGYELLESALEEAGAVPASFDAVGTVQPAAPRGLGRLTPVLLVSAALLLAGLFIWRSIDRSRPPASSVADLARIEALPVPTLRGPELAAGLAAYGEARFAEAEALLDAFVQENSASAIGWLYLGSARLLTGDPETAAEALEAAERAGEGTSLAREARWVRVQALLAAERPVEASVLLLVVSLESDGEREREVNELAAALASRAGS